MSSQTVKRSDFVKKLMQAGMSYEDSKKAYRSFVAVLEDAVVSGSRVNFGRLGALKPIARKSRSVHMGFERKGNTMRKTSKTYFLGRRITYKFQIYARFANSHELNWSNPGETHP